MAQRRQESVALLMMKENQVKRGRRMISKTKDKEVEGREWGR